MSKKTTVCYSDYYRNDGRYNNRSDFGSQERINYRKRNVESSDCSYSLNGKKVALLLIFSLFLIFSGIGVCSAVMGSDGSSIVEANQPLSEVKYKVVEIQYGDSLWSIAEEHMTPGFSDIYEYIDEIKRCNQLDSDHITSGCYLMIPYYEDMSL